MKKITIIFATLAFFFFAISCNQVRKRATSIPEDLSEITEQIAIIAYTDTTWSGRREIKRVRYINPVPVGGVRYRTYGRYSGLMSIVFTTDRPVTNELINGRDITERRVLLYADSLVLFLPDGNIRTGLQHSRRFAGDLYMPNYSEYDSTGILIFRQIENNWWYDTPRSIFDGWQDIGVRYAHEHFHPNGRIKRRTLLSSRFSVLVAVHEIEWDSLGRKTSLSHTEASMPPDAGHASLLQKIRTTTYFRPGGTIRQISRFNRVAVRAPECPCGEWLFFDEWGIEVDREEFAPCEDFVGCEGEWEWEEW